MWLLPISMLVTTTILAIPLSRYLAWIMDGKYHAPRWLRWFEKRLDSGPQNWKQYTASLLIFNSVLFVFGYIVLSLQPWMPLNPRRQRDAGADHDLSHGGSFMTNTDLQHYSGDVAFSNFSQIFFCHHQLLSVGIDRVLRLDRDHSRFSKRQAARKLLRRHVARGGVHVRAGFACHRRCCSFSRACR